MSTAPASASGAAEGSIDGLFDLAPLNKLLTDAGEDTVSAAGLGED